MKRISLEESNGGVNKRILAVGLHTGKRGAPLQRATIPKPAMLLPNLSFSKPYNGALRPCNDAVPTPKRKVWSKHPHDATHNTKLHRSYNEQAAAILNQRKPHQRGSGGHSRIIPSDDPTKHVHSARYQSMLAYQRISNATGSQNYNTAKSHKA